MLYVPNLRDSQTYNRARNNRIIGIIVNMIPDRLNTQDYFSIQSDMPSRLKALFLYTLYYRIPTKEWSCINLSDALMLKAELNTAPPILSIRSPFQFHFLLTVTIYDPSNKKNDL